MLEYAEQIKFRKLGFLRRVKSQLKLFALVCSNENWGSLSISSVIYQVRFLFLARTWPSIAWTKIK